MTASGWPAIDQKARGHRQLVGAGNPDQGHVPVPHARPRGELARTRPRSASTSRRLKRAAAIAILRPDASTASGTGESPLMERREESRGAGNPQHDFARCLTRSAIEIMRRPNLSLNSTMSGQAGDGAVVVHQLAQDAARVEAGQDRQVDRGLGVPGALQDAARPGPQGKHVARAHQVARAWTSGSPRMRIVRARSAALIPVVTPSAASTLTAKSVRCLSRLLATIGASPSLGSTSLFVATQTIPLPVPNHHPDRLVRHLRGRHDKVPLVLAPLVVGHDDHPAGRDVRHGRLHGVEGTMAVVEGIRTKSRPAGAAVNSRRAVRRARCN